jgi:hypothetical protein
MLQKLKAPVFRPQFTPANYEYRWTQGDNRFDTHELCGSALRCIGKPGNLQKLSYNFSFADITSPVKNEEALSPIAFHQVSQFGHGNFDFMNKPRSCGLFTNRIGKTFYALLNFAQAHPTANHNFLYVAQP